MNCPLKLYLGESEGTVQYYVAPCDCVKLCNFNDCKYIRNGFIVEIASSYPVLSGNSVSTTNTAVILTKCGGTLPLYADSNGSAVTVSQLTAGTLWRIYPTFISGAPKGIVNGL